MKLPSRVLRIVLLVVVSLALCHPSQLHAKGSKSGSSGGQKAVHVKGYTTKKGTYVAPHGRKAPTKHEGTSKTSTTSTTSRGSNAAKRDANSHIERSEAAKHAFMKQTGYPNGRPGYVVDHIRPLACGGADTTSNLQWQMMKAAKTKDAVERRGC